MQSMNPISKNHPTECDLGHADGPYNDENETEQGAPATVAMHEVNTESTVLFDAEDGTMHERANLIARIWNMLPIPLRSEFFIFYHDAEDNRELKRRTKIVEDVLYDFLSPLEDVLSRAERGCNDQKGERGAQDMGEIFSWWSSDAIDWEVIRQELIERITAIPEKVIDVDCYHGRGATVTPHRRRHRTTSYSPSEHTCETTERNRTNAAWHQPSNASDSRHLNASDKNIDQVRFPSTDRMKAWQSVGLPQMNHDQGGGEDATRPNRKFTRIYDTNGRSKMGFMKENTFIIVNEQDDHAWRKRPFNTQDHFQAINLLDNPTFESIRPGARKMRTLRDEDFDVKMDPNHKTNGTNNDEFKTLGDGFWFSLKWGNYDVAASILSKDAVDGMVYSVSYGTPFCMWMTNYLNAESTKGEVEFDDIPSGIRITAFTQVPKDCLASITFKLCEGNASIDIAELKPLDLCMKILHEHSCVRPPIWQKVIRLAIYLLGAEYGLKDLSNLRIPSAICEQCRSSS